MLLFIMVSRPFVSLGSQAIEAAIFASGQAAGRGSHLPRDEEAGNVTFQGEAGLGGELGSVGVLVEDETLQGGTME